MTARKRKQGQQRRLKKYIISQTGSTDTQSLREKEKLLQDKLTSIESQMETLQEELDHQQQDTVEFDTELMQQKTKRYQYLKDMKEHIRETILINQNIYKYMNQL